MDPIDVGTIIVAIIAAFGAWVAQRVAVKANRMNNIVSRRLEAEKGAYERARAFDIQTIDRQNAEVVRLRTANQELRRDLLVVEKRVAHLETCISDLEKELNNGIYKTSNTE